MGQLHPPSNVIGGEMQPSNNYTAHINSSSPVSYPMRSSYGSGIPTMPQQQQGKPRDPWLHPTMPMMHESAAAPGRHRSQLFRMPSELEGTPRDGTRLFAGPSRLECYSGGSLRYAQHIMHGSCTWVQAGRALDTCRASMFS